MTLVIHKEPYAPRLVTLGKADKVLAPDPKPEPRRVKMEGKIEQEPSVKTIREDDAGSQGAIGGGEINAQEKVPEGKEDKKDE